MARTVSLTFRLQFAVYEDWKETVSPDVGTPLGLQLVGVFQLLSPPTLVQTLLAPVLAQVSTTSLARAARVTHRERIYHAIISRGH